MSTVMDGEIELRLLLSLRKYYIYVSQPKYILLLQILKFNCIKCRHTSLTWGFQTEGAYTNIEQASCVVDHFNLIKNGFSLAIRRMYTFDFVYLHF